MGHRLSKIYTRTGDDGSTGLGDGSRTQKNSPRVEAFGTVDELNSFIGLLLSHPLPTEVSDFLSGIQHDLFDLGGEISIPGREALTADYVTRIETALDKYNAELAPLKEFILPGGAQTAALCHIIRTVCRRAERRLIDLKQAQPVSTQAICYLNRLSDFFFVLARYLNFEQGKDDVLWQPGRNQASKSEK
jgi:cob(I)alamin adenosyltransferase